MTTELQTDVGLLHVAGGAPRSTPPPGTMARAAPRRPARGRADDLLFITVQVQASDRVPPGMLDHLAQAGADVFYRTPGSVTSALREVMLEVGDELANAGRAQESSGRYLGRVVAAVLRDDNVYMAQCGPGQMTLIRQGQVSSFSSPEAANRPLGSAPNPFVRYHHLQVRPGDTLLMTPFDETLWTEGTLSALSGLPPAQGHRPPAGLGLQRPIRAAVEDHAPGPGGRPPPGCHRAAIKSRHFPGAISACPAISLTRSANLAVLGTFLQGSRLDRARGARYTSGVYQTRRGCGGVGCEDGARIG